MKSKELQKAIELLESIREDVRDLAQSEEALSRQNSELTIEVERLREQVANAYESGRRDATHELTSAQMKAI